MRRAGPPYPARAVHNFQFNPNAREEIAGELEITGCIKPRTALRWALEAPSNPKVRFIGSGSGRSFGHITFGATAAPYKKQNKRGGQMKEETKTRPWTALALAAALVLASWTLAVPARAAESRMVIPMGRAVGIKLFSDGVMVVGLSEVDGTEGSSAPARDCGLREGDIITHINKEEVDSIEEVQNALQQAAGAPMSIRAVRDDKTVQLTAQAVQCGSDGQYKLGAWIRDSMAGIGTLTFCEPETGLFGALGHGINDVDTAQRMPLQSGAILYAEITDVQQGEKGAPGELHGAFHTEEELGELYANTAGGVFGYLDEDALTGTLEPVPVAARSEVKTGRATILSNIAGDRVEEYEVELTRIYPASGEDTRNLMLKVTDPRLLEATGGIVQGMSGSPILQNGKLVGAVTHVLVNDPTQGYGILAETMLQEAESSAKSS